MSHLLLIVACLSLIAAPTSTAFQLTAAPPRRRVTVRRNSALFSKPSGDTPKALGAGSPQDEDALNLNNNLQSSSSDDATVALMITRDMKRVMIEELGYKRRDVDIMRPEFAGRIVEKRAECPVSGIPEDWLLPEEDRMLDKLKQESKYPLKVPLFGVSLVLFGKGLGDAAITLIKFNIGGYAANLADTFYGVPVLAIDAVCVIVGAALGYWTFNTMRDD